jgi:DNA polymerase I-like protein with 3'-5' exonuclease and polymerase domains
VHPPTTILTENQLARVVDYFSRYDALTFDVESIGEHRGIPALNDVTWISLATHGASVAIPMDHPIGDRVIDHVKVPKVGKDGKTRHYKTPVWEPPPTQLRRNVVFSALKPLLFSSRRKIGHGLAFDLASIAKYYAGQMPPPPYHCTLTSSWLLDENRLNGLKPRTKAEYGFDYDKEGVGKRVESFPFSTVALYSRLDSQSAWLLKRRQERQLVEQDLQRVWDLEMDVLQVCAEMHLAGAPVSRAHFERLRQEFGEQLETREAAVYKAAGKVFNISSPAQKSGVLYAPKRDGGQGLKPTKKTPGGDPSTDAEALSKHKDNPVAAAIMAYAETSKLVSTYVDGYLGTADKPSIIVNGRIHGTIQPYGTATGRCSSKNPNMQNIPIRTAEGKKIRQGYVAPEGHSLIIGDHGQVELVLLAHYAGDGALFQGFHEGIDPHLVTAAMILGISPDKVSPDERNKYGKTINFLIGYGGGVSLLAERAGITRSEAEDILQAHRAQFPEIYRYKSRLMKAARSRPDHHIRTLYGRKRRIPDLSSTDSYLRSRAERQLINSHIQGSNGDLNKLSMVRTRSLLREHGYAGRARLILTVHDEIGVESETAIAEHVADLVRDAMIGPDMQSLLTVPLTADIHTVKDWASAK